MWTIYFHLFSLFTFNIESSFYFCGTIQISRIVLRDRKKGERHYTEY